MRHGTGNMQGDMFWISDPGQTSPEVQNRDKNYWCLPIFLQMEDFSFIFGVGHVKIAHGSKRAFLILNMIYENSKSIVKALETCNGSLQIPKGVIMVPVARAIASGLHISIRSHQCIFRLNMGTRRTFLKLFIMNVGSILWCVFWISKHHPALLAGLQAIMVVYENFFLKVSRKFLSKARPIKNFRSVRIECSPCGVKQQFKLVGWFFQ